jgi:hypothetical protein
MCKGVSQNGFCLFLVIELSCLAARPTLPICTCWRSRGVRLDLIAMAESCCGCIWDAFKRCCQISTGCIKRLSVRTVSIILRVFNIVNAALLAVCSFIAFQNYEGNATSFFLACYTGFFAVLLALFETRISWTEQFIRRLFGFLFSPAGMGPSFACQIHCCYRPLSNCVGRTLFIVFVGAIVFGLCDSCGSPPFSTACSW